MFFHIFKYELLKRIRQKEGLFWTLLFPIILSTLFYFAFGNLGNTEKFEKINIGIVQNDVTDKNLLDAIKKSDMFILTYTSQEDANKLLENNSIIGYLSGKEKVDITIKNTGLQQSMLKMFMDKYSQVNSTVSSIYMLNPKGVSQEFLGSLNTPESFIENKPISSSNDNNVVYFYALIAMSCLFAATFGAHDVIGIQANQSTEAARLSIAPTHKLKIFFAKIFSTMVLQFSSILIVLAYITQILKVDFGNSMGNVILLSLVATLTGITFGTALSSLLVVKENTKIGIISSTVMLSSFLSGLMSVDVKYMIKLAFPPISYVNPASIITDGFLSLYYYSSLDKYFECLILLLAFSFVFSTITYLVLRRQKYASI